MSEEECSPSKLPRLESPESFPEFPWPWSYSWTPFSKTDMNKGRLLEEMLCSQALEQEKRMSNVVENNETCHDYKQ